VLEGEELTEVQALPVLLGVPPALLALGQELLLPLPATLPEPLTEPVLTLLLLGLTLELGEALPLGQATAEGLMDREALTEPQAEPASLLLTVGAMLTLLLLVRVKEELPQAAAEVLPLGEALRLCFCTLALALLLAAAVLLPERLPVMLALPVSTGEPEATAELVAGALRVLLTEEVAEVVALLLAEAAATEGVPAELSVLVALMLPGRPPRPPPLPLLL
jgi:hypothetical protein